MSKTENLELATSEKAAFEDVVSSEIVFAPTIPSNATPRTWTDRNGVSHEGYIIKDGQRQLSFLMSGKQICGAKTRADSDCQRLPVAGGANRCKFHGGASLSGVAHPQYKDGSRARGVIARKLGQMYEDALQDDRLLELRSDLAIIEYRLADLIDNMEEMDSGDNWKEVERLYSRMRKAVQSNNQQSFLSNLNLLGQLITKGVSEHDRWQVIIDTIQNRRILVESERRRLVEMQQMMTAEQAMAMLTYVVSVIRKHVDDPKTLAAISTDISAYIGAKR